jgi:hypothetical protein
MPYCLLDHWLHRFKLPHTMSNDTQPLPKRGRTVSDLEYQSATEELSRVASLVERRRVQNRISQRNYRE